MYRWARRLSGGVLARNTLWMFVAFIGRTAMQAVYFIIVARCLGPRGYGTFISAVALVGVAAPFASLGAGNLLIRDVARDPSQFRKCWSNVLWMTVFSGVLLIFGGLSVSRFILPGSVPLMMVSAIAVSDILCTRLVDVSGQAFQAHERLGWTARFQILLGVIRLAAACVLVLFVGSPTPTAWSLLYLASSASCMVVAVRAVHRHLGRPKGGFRLVRGDLKEGMYFSVGLSSQGIYNDIDKTMLARYATLEAAGTYAVAYRLIDTAFMPVRSLIFASYARFFQAGAGGISASHSLARRLVPIAGLYSVGAGVVLFLGAPLLPSILGRDYEASVGALRWLAILPLFKSFHYFAANALTGAGHQGLRSGIQVGCAVFNVAINLILIPKYSWQGAAVSSILSDGLLAVCMWLAVWRKQCVTAGVAIEEIPSYGSR